ncbi:KxYKxGKxW signal peptide domain-containing protein [Lactiplantibacillus pentosus]
MSKDNQKMTGDSIYRVKMYKDGKRWGYDFSFSCRPCIR